eukprot:scaffold18997_cov101-Isochrysis_galbana.AAC.3
MERGCDPTEPAPRDAEVEHPSFEVAGREGVDGSEGAGEGRGVEGLTRAASAASATRGTSRDDRSAGVGKWRL